MKNPIGQVPFRKPGENTCPRAGQPAICAGIQPVQRCCHLRIRPAHYRFAVVRQFPCRKSSQCDPRCSAHQIRRLEYVRGDDRCVGIDKLKPVFRQFHRFQYLSHSFAPGGEPAHEYRDVGAQAQTLPRRAGSVVRPVSHRQFRATRVVAASELPPPSPPPMGMFLSTLDVCATWRRRQVPGAVLPPCTTRSSCSATCW